MEGDHLGAPLKIGLGAPTKSENIYWKIFLGPFEKSGSNPVTFPFSNGVTLFPLKVCPPPMTEILATPCRRVRGVGSYSVQGLEPLNLVWGPCNFGGNVGEIRGEMHFLKIIMALSVFSSLSSPNSASDPPNFFGETTQLRRVLGSLTRG